MSACRSTLFNLEQAAHLEGATDVDDDTHTGKNGQPDWVANRVDNLGTSVASKGVVPAQAVCDQPRDAE